MLRDEYCRRQLALDGEAEKVIAHMSQLHRNLDEKWTKVNCSVLEWKAKIDALLPVSGDCTFRCVGLDVIIRVLDYGILNLGGPYRPKLVVKSFARQCK